MLHKNCCPNLMGSWGTRAGLQVAMTHPMAVTNCNIDMETLISDQNRSIATLAITTLLKTGNEGSVERLLKQVCPCGAVIARTLDSLLVPKSL
jgi:Adaptin N terminal region